MENGAAESGTELLRPFGNGGDLFNSAILLMSSPGKWSSGWPHGWFQCILATSVGG